MDTEMMTDGAKFAAKEDRNASEFAAIKQAQRERAAAWTPAEAQAKAYEDGTAFRDEVDGMERYHKVLDMAVYADASYQYKDALRAVAPEVFAEFPADEPRDEAEAVKLLARDLAKIAAGEMHSDKVLHASIARFESMRAQPEGVYPGTSITKDRLDQALVHCKLALHGIRESHHALGEASVMLHQSTEAPRGVALASQDAAPQAAALRGVDESRVLLNAMLNYMDFPERVDASWLATSIQRHARGLPLAEPAPVVPMLIKDSQDQPEAKALTARVAAELGGLLGDWRQAQANEWQTNNLTLPDGRSVRVAASTGGVVSVNGDPFTPWPDRNMNLSHEAVTESLRAALDAAPRPAYPIKRDQVQFNGGEIRQAWIDMGEAENRLAGYLSSLDDGTAVFHGRDAWYLQEVDKQLVLMHASLEDGKIVGAQSRFEFALDAVDIGADELTQYTKLVESIASDFVIDRALWKTMPVELDESPSPSL